MYPPDEEAKLWAAAEAARLAAEADEAALAEFMRREGRRKDTTHPETKAELERDTARAHCIYVSLERHMGPNSQPERESGHPGPEGNMEVHSQSEREIERPSPKGKGEPSSQAEKKNRISRMWKRVWKGIKGGKKVRSRSENKAV